MRLPRQRPAPAPTRIAVSVFVAIAALPTSAESPLRDAVGIAVRPTESIRHGVEHRSVFETRTRYARLTGPRYFVTTDEPDPASEGDPSTEAAPVFHTVYEVGGRELNGDRLVPMTMKKVRVRMAGDHGEVTFDAGRPRFFFSTAQRLGTGTPAAVPEGSDLLTAYPIEGIEPVPGLDGTLPPMPPESMGSKTRLPLIAIPTEQRHHDDRTPITHGDRGWLIFLIDDDGTDTDAPPPESPVTILDQFGLNRLDRGSVSWRLVPIELTFGDD